MNVCLSLFLSLSLSLSLCVCVFICLYPNLKCNYTLLFILAMLCCETYITDFTLTPIFNVALSPECVVGHEQYTQHPVVPIVSPHRESKNVLCLTMKK